MTAVEALPRPEHVLVQPCIAISSLASKQCGLARLARAEVRRPDVRLQWHGAAI